MSENEELELGAKVAELDKRAARLDERENQLNKRQKQLKTDIDAFNQEKEAYLKNQKEFEDFMEDKEVFKKEQVQKVKENLRTYEKEQKELILETIGKQLQEQQESLNKDYGKKLESIKEHSDRLENDLKTQFDAQLEKWEQNFKGYEQQLTDILNDKAQLDLDKQRFNAQKQAFENHIKQREEEIKKENQNEIVHLNKDKSDLHRQLDEMANEMNALRQKNRELKEKIDWQKDYDMEKLEQDNRDLENCKENLLVANENLKNRIQELENEKNKLDSRDERIKELEEEKRELEGIWAQKEDAEQKCARLSAYNVSLEADLNTLNERFENLKNIYVGAEDLKKRQENIKEQIAKTNPKGLGAPSNVTEELAFLERIEKGMQEFNVFYPKRLLYMFHTALKSASLSPLSVLSGVSGTGKSELPKLYAHFGGLNFLSIAVQPTWDSPESLMGYFNAIENKFDATEFLRFFIRTTLSKDENKESYGLKEAMNVVLLDEMNLAHIELYFAEFLSKLEIKRSKETKISIKLGTGLTWELPLGDNLLFVGTMNEDESTKMLSDKVLDRAFCLNFERPKTLKSKQQKSLPNNDEYLKVETFNRWINKDGNLEAKLEKYKKLTEEINERLRACYRSIGHRVWQSMSAYMHNHPLVLHASDASDKDKALQFAYEECLVLKIFPKLRGVQTRNNQHLIEIQNLLKDFSVSWDFKQAMENDFNQFVFNSADYLNNAEYEKLLKK
ncbi:restriction endonuclease [Helicobacter pylori]|uniref:restriction endonuclease n=1 Tax=Helicobacter pylori TaxID=210 RepID=UPI001924987B|nr:restriction endonuclease [Helicobacter pylori]QQW83835.1 restriction endonuclease [Helicobacter pylori]